jgi:heat shock protein 4
VVDAVVGVPSWWNDAQRRALLDAANVAGLNVLRLLNETTAVALQYGILKPLSKSQELKCLFVDVGHSSTQVSLVSFTEGKLTVLGTAADRNLGGRDFDDVLVQHFHAYIKDKYKMDVSTEVKAMSKLRKEVSSHTHRRSRLGQ